MRQGSAFSSALKIAGVYLGFAVLWILLSDRITRWAVPDADTMAWFQTAKGLGFVLASAGVLYVMTKRYLDRAEASTDRMRQAYDQTLAGWAAAIDIRDQSTGRHTQRVAALTVVLAERYGIEGTELDDVHRGATLHDIGKMAVPDRILGKAGPLTDEEWQVMRLHPEAAHTMLSGIGFLETAVDIPWCHHERWDGSGYPRGLAGTDIPLSARLFAVVDVYDALTSDRPYREPMPVEEALSYIEDQAGSHFDPAVVAEFTAMMRERQASGVIDSGGRL